MKTELPLGKLPRQLCCHPFWEGDFNRLNLGVEER